MLRMLRFAFAAFILTIQAIFALIGWALGLALGLFILLIGVGLAMAIVKAVVQPSQPPPGQWALHQDQLNGNLRLVSLRDMVPLEDNGSLTGEVWIRCRRQGITPVQTLDLIFLMDGDQATISSVSFRRQDSPQIVSAADYLIGEQDKSRVLVSIKPVESMTDEEKGAEFGLQGLVIAGAWLFSTRVSDRDAIAAMDSVIRHHYEPIFSRSPLLISVSYRDSRGEHAVSRTVAFDKVGGLTSKFFEACSLKDPFPG